MQYIVLHFDVQLILCNISSIIIWMYLYQFELFHQVDYSLELVALGRERSVKVSIYLYNFPSYSIGLVTEIYLKVKNIKWRVGKRCALLSALCMSSSELCVTHININTVHLEKGYCICSVKNYQSRILSPLGWNVLSVLIQCCSRSWLRNLVCLPKH